MKTRFAAAVIATSGLMLMLSNAPARAAAILDFGVVVPTAGTIKYPVAGGTLHGVNIQVDNVGDTVNPPVDCIGCVLNFTTGNLTGTTGTTWSFGGGPATTITIVGGVDLNGNHVLDAGDIPAGTLLLSGTFGDATVTKLGAVFKIAGGAFTDTKDPDLLAFFGLPSLHVGSFNISFNAAGSPPGTFTSTQVLSGDIVNQTPEPGTLMLLGSGLTGFGYLALRRRRRVS